MDVCIALFCLSVILANVLGGHSHHAWGDHIGASSNDRPVVRIKSQGLFRGRKSADGRYYEYMGIPYATASQENRFKSPLPVPTWRGIKEAPAGDVACVQKDIVGVVGIEDCLIVNVYSPANRPPFARLPVMVFVHGGDFNYGSATKDVYGPDRFVQDGVILVTLTYRLSIFGFLCVGDTANVGIKDVLAALRWIQLNIATFGGDPRKVTLFGESTGAAVIDLLVLSKKTEGLISKAIAQSGSAFSPWAFGSDPEEKAFKVGKILGYEGRDHDALLRVLRNASLVDLIDATETLTQIEQFEYIPIGPCVEPSSNVDAIVTSDPLSKLRSGDFNDVPYLMGINKDEGMLIYITIQQVPNYLDLVQNEFARSIPKDLQTPPIQSERIAELAKNFYFGEKNISADVPKAVEYFTDLMYALPTVKMARSHITWGSAPVYVYEFAYDGGLAYFKPLLNLTSIPGVCHADELGYLFTQPGVSSNRSDDLLTARRLTKMWTNFAKFSDPTPTTSQLIPVKWERAEDEKLKYLYIDSTLTPDREPFKRRVDFWDNIYKTYAPSLQ